MVTIALLLLLKGVMVMNEKREIAKQDYETAGGMN